MRCANIPNKSPNWTYERPFKENKHWAFLALAIISLVLGVIVMCNPFTLFRTFAVISGISLVYSGIVSLLSEIKSGGKSKSDESAEKAK